MSDDPEIHDTVLTNQFEVYKLQREEARWLLRAFIAVLALLAVFITSSTVRFIEVADFEADPRNFYPEPSGPVRELGIGIAEPIVYLLLSIVGVYVLNGMIHFLRVLRADPPEPSIQVNQGRYGAYSKRAQSHAVQNAVRLRRLYSEMDEGYDSLQAEAFITTFAIFITLFGRIEVIFILGLAYLFIALFPFLAIGDFLLF